MDKNGKILIVDDAKSNREILSEILNQYTVIEAKDGYEALEYLKSDSKSVALVLLDLVMPEMDGFEVLKYMNQNHLIEEVPVMIISIDKDDKSIEKAYELGVSGYITRPFSSAVVLKKINNIISHYKRQKKLTTIINKQIYEKYKNNDMMIMILSHIVESRNGESGLHVLHIKKLTKLLLNILVCSLLETTSIKTGKIAMMVGYRDTNYFSLAFKKHTGKSPTKYREEMQK